MQTNDQRGICPICEHGNRLNGEIVHAPNCTAITTPPAEASSGLPDEPQRDVHWCSTSAEWVAYADKLRAHAASLSRELAAKDGEIARLQQENDSNIHWAEASMSMRMSAAQQLAEQAARVNGPLTIRVRLTMQRQHFNDYQWELIESALKGLTP